jgi:hypothetical protein
MRKNKREIISRLRVAIKSPTPLMHLMISPTMQAAWKRMDKLFQSPMVFIDEAKGMDYGHIFSNMVKPEILPRPESEETKLSKEKFEEIVAAHYSHFNQQQHPMYMISADQPLRMTWGNAKDISDEIIDKGHWEKL